VLQSTTVEKSSGGSITKPSGKKYLEAPDEFGGEPETDGILSFDADEIDATKIESGLTVLKLVGLAGDTIRFPIGEKDTALLIVPEEALDLNVTLSLKADLVPKRDEKMSVAMYDFFPEGLVYLKDCYLIQPTRFPDGTLLALSWFDPLSNKWEQESVARVQNGRAVFVIKHFSKYGAPYDGLGSGGQQ
jgi:hypothetical protein